MFSAASTTDAAIADSTQREGNDTTPSVARLSVIECATVKAVTILNTSQNAGAKRIDRLPASSLRDQHRRQQQRQEKQDMVEADPDMPDAFARELQELPQTRWRFHLESLACPFRTEDRRTRGAAMLQAQQTAMLRVDIEKQAVVDVELPERPGAGRHERSTE